MEFDHSGYVLFRSMSFSPPRAECVGMDVPSQGCLKYVALTTHFDRNISKNWNQSYYILTTIPLLKLFF